MTLDREDDLPALAWVPLEGRGSLPFALVHGESLVAAASWAAGEAGFDLVEERTSLADVRREGRTLVLHDPLCPLAPPDFLAAACARCEETGQVVVGFRPVTDTVKEVHDGRVGRTLDREDLLVVTTPIVLPVQVLADLPDLRLDDFAALFEALVAVGSVELVEAPLLARRVTGEDDLRMLEALSRTSAQPS